MPYKAGRNTYKGYESPNTHGWPQPIREEVRKVYGAWREKNPGEDPKIKSRGARIAWSAARRKYPKLFAQHAGAIKEKKEHPWASSKTAAKIARDHIAEDPKAYLSEAKKTLNPVTAKNAEVKDLKAAAKEQHTWSREAAKEGREESKMAQKAKRAGNKVQSRDLRQDAKLAKDFSKFRELKAENYDLQAARIAAVKGD